MEIPVFRYMRWAKTHAGTCRYDLTMSGMPSAEVPDLARPAENRQMPAGDGDPVCERLVAERYGVPPEHVLFVPGSTMANFLLPFVLMERGDRVLVEDPAYENLPGVVRLLGGEVARLPRPAEAGYGMDLAVLEEGLSTGARLALLTDLHNPTGVRLAPEEVEGVRDLARRHGARVVIDEVYRDYLEERVGTAYRPDDPTILVASSLTKVYGMGALRTGWVLCPPDLRREAAHLLDYLTVLMPSASAAAAEHVLRNAEEVRAKVHAVARAGWQLFSTWTEGRGDVSCVPPAGGLTCFVGFDGIEDTTPLCEWLLAERDTAVVPGAFFGDPSRLRLAFGVDPDVLRSALEHLAEGVERFRVDGATHQG
jgi:aspartate/methionine/tyrosine aminotransferase